MNLFSAGSCLFIAKIVFIISGYAIYAALPRLLGQNEFGIFLLVNSVVAVLNAVFITGTIQTVSKFISEAPARGATVMRAARRLQLLLAGGVSALYFAAAPVIANLLRDPSLTGYLQVSAVIPFCYALYAVSIGYLNGHRRFVQQSLFDIAFSIIKVSLVVTLPILGYGAMGAVGGFSAAAAVILAAALLFVRPGPSDAAESPIRPATILKFELAVMAYVGLMNLLMQTDLMMVKRLSPVDAGNALAAAYGAAVKLAQIPQSLLVALNFVIFPLIARAVAEGDASKTSGYIAQALRLCVILVCGPATILALVSGDALRLVFGAAYASSADVLATLSFGYMALSLLGVALTVINSAGKPMHSCLIVGGTLMLQVVMNAVLIPQYGLRGAALGTASAYTGGFVISLVYLKGRFASTIPALTVVRVAAATAIVAVIGSFLAPHVPFLVSVALMGIVYAVAIFALGEVRLAEIVSLTGRGTLDSKAAPLPRAVRL